MYCTASTDLTDFVRSIFCPTLIARLSQVAVSPLVLPVRQVTCDCARNRKRSHRRSCFSAVQICQTCGQSKSSLFLMFLTPPFSSAVFFSYFVTLHTFCYSSQRVSVNADLITLQCLIGDQ